MKRKIASPVYFYLCFLMLYIFMHTDLSCQDYPLFIYTAHYTLCVVQMFPHTYFSSGFSVQIFLQACFLPLLLACLYKQQIAF